LYLGCILIVYNNSTMLCGICQYTPPDFTPLGQHPLPLFQHGLG